MQIENLNNLDFLPKNWFYRYKNIFLIWNRVNSDRSELDHSDETIRIKNFPLSRQLWWKKLLKITEIATLPKSDRSKILIAQIEDLNEDDVQISYLL